jgi:hypothetical protein
MEINNPLTFIILVFNTKLNTYKHMTLHKITEFYIKWPNVVVEWLKLLLRFREVPGSNLSSETGYPDWGFSWFCSVPLSECRVSTLQLGHDRSFPYPFKFIIHLSQFISTLYSLGYWRASLNKLKLNKYTVWFGVPLKITSKVFSLTTFKSMVVQNDDSSRTYRYVNSLLLY